MGKRTAISSLFWLTNKLRGSLSSIVRPSQKEKEKEDEVEKEVMVVMVVVLVVCLKW